MLLLVVGRANIEGMPVAGPKAVLLENAQARRMKGPHPRKLEALESRQPLQAVLHLVGRLVGEGNGEDPRRIVASPDEIRELGREHPGLPRTCPCSDEGRLAHVLDGPLLDLRQVDHSSKPPLHGSNRLRGGLLFCLKKGNGARGSEKDPLGRAGTATKSARLSRAASRPGRGSPLFSLGGRPALSPPRRRDCLLSFPDGRSDLLPTRDAGMTFSPPGTAGAQGGP